MKNEELYATAVELRILGGIVMKLVRRDVEQHLEACGAEIGSLQHGVLRLLSQQHFTIAELSRKMMLEAASLVPVIESLEKGALVKRGQDPRDRRRTPLTLTEQGAELLARIPSASPDSLLVKSLHQMGDAKSEQLLQRLRELVTLLTEDENIVREISASVRRDVDENKKRGSKLKQVAKTKLISKDKALA